MEITNGKKKKRTFKGKFVKNDLHDKKENFDLKQPSKTFFGLNAFNYT